MKKSAGFTLLELIIVVAVILVISVVTILNYNSYTDKQRVKQAGLTLRSDLRLAQIKATSGQKPFSCDDSTTLVNYTVSFFSTCSGKGPCYEIKPVCTKAGVSVDTSDDVTRIMLPTGVTFQSSYTPIAFSSVTGVTDLSETKLLIVTGAGTTYTVSVSPSGSVSDH